jgi:uncharacterized phage infection (PIP) family protein YhgE
VAREIAKLEVSSSIVARSYIMTAITETDLKRLEDLINSRFNSLEKGQQNLHTRFDSLEKGQQNLQIEVTEIKIKLNTIEPSIQKLPELAEKVTEVRTKLNTLEPSIQKLPELAEKVGELKNWKQIGLILMTAIISSILSSVGGGVIGWLIRGGKI